MTKPVEERTEYPGIVTRTYGDGRKPDPVYVVRWREGGRGSRGRSQTFPTKAKAVRFQRDGYPDAPTFEPEPDEASDEPKSFAEYGALWKATLGTRKPSTRRGYESLYDVHVLPAFIGKPVASITYTDTQAFLSRMALAGSSESQRRSAYWVLSMVLNVAVHDGALAVSPCAKGKAPSKPKRKKGARVPLDLAQLEMLAGECGAGHELLVLTLGLTGLRIGEAAGLFINDVDTMHGVIRVLRAQDQKTGVLGSTKGGEPRTVEIPPTLTARLARHIAKAGRGPNERLFFGDPHASFGYRGAPINDNTLRARVIKPAIARLIAAGKLPADFAGFTTHDLRHTYEYVCEDAGVPWADIQRQLGHSPTGSDGVTFGYSRGRVGRIGELIEAAWQKRLAA
jgi:integrase